jgi:hypothetical protein
MLLGIGSRFASLETRRRDMLQRVTALEHLAQVARPTPTEFSPAEILMHMALVEEFHLKHLEKSPPESFRGQQARPSFIFPSALKRMRSAKKVGTLKSMTPIPGVNLESASERWEQARRSLHNYFDRVTDPNETMIRLPIFGRLSALDYLSLLESHTQYHEVRFPA